MYSRHCSVYLQERVVVHYRAVAADRENTCSFVKAPVRECLVCTFFAEDLRIRIRGKGLRQSQVFRLYGRDHAEFSDPVKVCIVNKLEMFDSVAAFVFAVLVYRCFYVVCLLYTSDAADD